MSEKIERELLVEAPVERVWDAVTGDGWLAEEVELDLHPGVVGQPGLRPTSEVRLHRWGNNRRH